MSDSQKHIWYIYQIKNMLEDIATKYKGLLLERCEF